MQFAMRSIGLLERQTLSPVADLAEGTADSWLVK